MYPCGMTPRWPSSLIWVTPDDETSAAFVKAGVHSNTKTYILPSNSDWIRPKNKIFRSKFFVFFFWKIKIKLIKIQFFFSPFSNDFQPSTNDFETAAFASPKFSVQVKTKRTFMTIKTVNETSKGALEWNQMKN